MRNPLTAILLFGFVAGAVVILYRAWTQVGSIPSTQTAGIALLDSVLLLCFEGGAAAFPGVFVLRLKGPGKTLTGQYISWRLALTLHPLFVRTHCVVGYTNARCGCTASGIVYTSVLWAVDPVPSCTNAV